MPKPVAVAALAMLLLAGGGAAQAQWRDDGRGYERGGRRYEAGRPDGGRYDGGRYDGGRYDRRGGDWRGGGYGGRPGGAYPSYEGAGYAPRFSGGEGGGPQGWRRGQVIPPSYRGAYVPDPGRYRLRAAPNGYGWVGDGRNAYLMQRSTGLVLDSVPGAYDPAPDRRGPRRR